MNRHKKISFVIAAIVLIVVVVFYFSPRAEIYGTYTNPTGTYRLVVYRSLSRLSVLPGDASGAPGFVRLYNAHGTLRGKADLPIVAAADEVKWDEHDVSTPGVFDLLLQ